jgi:glycosyltransferase involved in cell wall biosynthesis
MAVTMGSYPRVAAGAPGIVSRRLHVMVLGLRGIVDVQGGIETHARRLYPLLARLGWDIEVVQRSPYFPLDRRRSRWHGLRLTYLWSPRTTILETAVHTFLGVLYAAIKRPDVLHLHAVGPGLLAPLARLFGLRVVITHHGADYEREKWGRMAKALLRTGERLGIGFAHRPIVVSPVLKQKVDRRYSIDTTLIPNGAPLASPTHTRRILERLQLKRRRYVLCVGRLDPGKRQLDLIEAFEAAALEGWKLVIVGEVEAGNAYCDELVARAARNPAIVLTGYQNGSALHELYSHAGLFVLPSAAEGHPIALLEAAVYEVPMLASAIPANLALPLPHDRYFPVGDTATLALKLKAYTHISAAPAAESRTLHEAVRAHYSWRNAAELTSSVYQNVARAAWQRG